MLYFFFGQQFGEIFGLFDRDRTHQHRLLFLICNLDFTDDRAVFFKGGAVNFIVMVDAQNTDVGWDINHFKFVNIAELTRFGHRRSGHA